jgi:hypothetical protein
VAGEQMKRDLAAGKLDNVLREVQNASAILGWLRSVAQKFHRAKIDK